ncbi:MAG: O-sialoglycoprotein endopeptidase [Hyphomonadaceae bacterium]|nr:O-sialoglycoprotein endopeptidase [Clostridia bacterium]
MRVLAIDTSCYTTSIALMEDNHLLADARKVLTVDKGQRGLRQSEGIFQHTKNLPSLYHAMKKTQEISPLQGVAVSVKPRRAENSYMPVFLAGEGMGRVVADSLNVQCIQTTHQEGHIMAGIWSSQAWQLLNKPFLAVHLSGGTTEILHISPQARQFQEQIIGGTLDLHAGQLVDRVGVRLGLDFPCGQALEHIALKSQNPIALPVSTKGMHLHFSGVETKAQRMIEAGANHEDLAAGVFICIAQTLCQCLREAMEQTALHDILIVGGVAANSLIRQHLIKAMQNDCTLHFANPKYATDNAVGVACMGIWQLGGFDAK